MLTDLVGKRVRITKGNFRGREGFVLSFLRNEEDPVEVILDDETKTYCEEAEIEVIAA